MLNKRAWIIEIHYTVSCKTPLEQRKVNYIQSASYFFIIYFNLHANASTWSLPSIFHDKISYEFIIFLHANSKPPPEILLMLECITGIIYDLQCCCICTIFRRSVSNLKHLRDLVRWILQELCKGKLYRERRRVHGSLIQRPSYHAARVNKYLGVLVCIGRQRSPLILTGYLQFMLMDTWYRDYKNYCWQKVSKMKFKTKWYFQNIKRPLNKSEI